MENDVSGTCNFSGSLNFQWSTSGELHLVPFRLPGRKAGVSMNLKSSGFSLKIPYILLKAPNETGFPSGGINIPEITIGAKGDFITDLNAFSFNGISMSNTGSDNHIKLYGKDRMIRIRNKKTTTTTKKNVFDAVAGIWKTVTETVVNWVNQTFRIRVTLKYGSAGTRADVQIL